MEIHDTFQITNLPPRDDLGTKNGNVKWYYITKSAPLFCIQKFTWLNKRIVHQMAKLIFHILGTS